MKNQIKILSTKTQPALNSIHGGMTRRRFVSRCAACMGCGALSFLDQIPSRAAEAVPRKPKIRLVFCETPNDQPIWPNIGYDFAARRKQISKLLTKNCPELEFLQVSLMNDPKQADSVLRQDAEVDGYLVCVEGLGWNNDIAKMCTTGKPTLLADNLFGGSGLFLEKLSGIMSSGKPVDWVSSSNDQHLAESARHFAGLVKGKSGSDTAAAFRATRRKNTPAVVDWNCMNDPVPSRDFDRALQQLHKTRILVVGSDRDDDGFRKASLDVTGVEFVPISFEEMAGAYEQADMKGAKEFADRWMGKAQSLGTVKPEVVEKSGAMYVAMKGLMDKYGARGISINCLGGFYEGHLKAYPCLGFSQFNNDGLVGGCEADQMSALTMTVMGALTGRPGMISDPVIDTSKNAIVYVHCVAMTKPFGPDGAANAYQILTHSEDRQGASIRSLLPAGYMTTTLEINPTSRQVLIHRAKTIGNNSSDLACRTKLEAVVKGDLEKLTEHWRMGWHRVTFYGDLHPQVVELCQQLRLDLIEEA
ncbi:MAG TPA: hypothetical protein VMW38_00335 [Terriglobia bacterium]|nr:hypothetical protein [Terriglobia bacterium]